MSSRKNKDPRFENTAPRVEEKTWEDHVIAIFAAVQEQWQEGFWGKLNMICMFMAIVLITFFVFAIIGHWLPTFDPSR